MTVMVIILLESILLSLMGGAFGMVLGPRRDLALLAVDRRLDRAWSSACCNSNGWN